jgi:amidase
VTARLDSEFEELTIGDFLARVLAGTLTSVELVNWYLARIEATNESGPELQAVVTVNPRALDEAADRDAFFASTGDLVGPLHGIPVLVKDQAESSGIRTTFGSKLFELYVPDRDATLITKLRNAGAVLLAKTSLCDFAAGWFSSSSITGHTKNPYSFEHEAGGSSAGTAAGVAANLGLVGIGEDTGGSIRVPASFNNLYGLRVTTGLISRTGFSPLVHFQDTPGPLGRTVSDVASLLDCIVGFDPDDPMTSVAKVDPKESDYAESLAKRPPIEKWRIGVLGSAFESDANPDAAPVNRVIRSAIADLKSMGVPIVEALEIADLSQWLVETSGYVQQSKSDISRFLADRPGAPVSSFMEIYESGTFHPLNDLFHAIASGPETVAHADYVSIRQRQDGFQVLLLRTFSLHELDFLVYPTVRVVPPSRRELADLKYDCLTFPTNTVLAAQAGLPALTIPVGFTDSGMPTGMELLGAPRTETALLQFAYAWEQASPFRKAPILYADTPDRD